MSTHNKTKETSGVVSKATPQVSQTYRIPQWNPTAVFSTGDPTPEEMAQWYQYFNCDVFPVAMVALYCEKHPQNTTKPTAEQPSSQPILESA